MDDQIARYKARRTKKRLAYYGLGLSLYVTLASLGSGITLTGLISLLVLLPLPLYFALQSLKFYAKSTLRPLTPNAYYLQSKFSFGEFITQPNWAFRLSLLLFFVTCFVTLARVSSEPSLLTMIP